MKHVTHQGETEEEHTWRGLELGVQVLTHTEAQGGPQQG